MKSQTIARVAQSVSAVLLLAGLALPSHVAAAPVLSMSNAVGFPRVNVSVALSNNTPSVPYDPLAGVQFDITPRTSNERTRENAARGHYQPGLGGDKSRAEVRGHTTTTTMTTTVVRSSRI